jgi:ribosomal protein S18 acetylase RimI-like enzyme
MKQSDLEIIFRLHKRSDTYRIVTMINRDPFHMLNGVTVEEFEQDLDEPGGRIRDNTFVAVIGQTTVGYFSLCFVELTTHIVVKSFGTVDVDWRRRGIGNAMFKFIFTRLEGIARNEAKPVHFIHRALTCISGETSIGANFGMQEQNTLEILCLKNMVDLKVLSQPSEFQFRTPTLEDANVWADIYNDAFGGNKSLENVVHEFQRTSFSPNLYILSTNEMGYPIGLLSSIRRGTHARIPTLAVRREWQKRGIGDAMLSEILQRLQHTGVDEVRLTVDSNNYAAKSLYIKFGFQLDYKRIHYIATFSPKSA